MERVGQGRLLVAYDSWDYAYDGIGHYGSRQFSACQHIVANGHLSGDETLAYAIVDALVVSAQDDDVLLQREFVGHGLVKLLAVGGSEDNLVVVALAHQFGDAQVHGFALDNHTSRTAKRIVVHTTPAVGGVVTQIVDMYFHKSFFLPTTHDALLCEGKHQFGAHGDNVYSHS